MALSFTNYVTSYYKMDDALKIYANTLKRLKVTQVQDLAVEALARKLEGYNTCTRFLLERINPNIVDNQISSVDSKFELVRRIALLEPNLNQLVNK